MEVNGQESRGETRMAIENPYRSPKDSNEQVHSQRAGTRRVQYVLLFTSNLLYHVLLLCVIRAIDPWLVFRDWYRILVWYVAPTMTTLFVTNMISKARGSIVGGAIAVILSIVLASLHNAIIWLLAAAV